MPLSAIIIDNRDNVATAIRQLEPGEQTVLSVESNTISTQILQTIPSGHKFAIRDIPAGNPVIKYGEVIGLATVNILAGQHVHVHNVEGVRGRGDKK